MLDAHPAPPAPAHPSAAALPTTAISDPAAPPPTSAPSALLTAARALLPVLEAGRALDARTLREAMTSAFGGSDADGAWLWRDSYEAAEAALVLFLQRYGRAMRREAGAGPGGPAAMLRMLQTLAALEPSQTRRSEEQLKFQQFSTPLPLAYAALQAAMIRPGDVVLEPSAGTGMLAVMAQLALGKDTNALHLNEIAAARAGLLAGLFPGSTVTRHNAESIRDRLPQLRPTVVLMNPPFSSSPGVDRIRHHADLHHIRSACSMLPPGGRLVAISSAHCVPGDAAWADAFASLDPPAHAVFTAPIDGRAYARRGTTFDTRLTVLDRGGEKPARVYAGHPVRDAGHLLQALTGTVPARRPIEPVPGADLFGQAPAPSRRSRTEVDRRFAPRVRIIRSALRAKDIAMTRRPIPPRRRPPAIPFAGLALAVLAIAAVLAADHGRAAADTWRGLAVAPEHRCTPYDRSDYPYPRSAEREIVASMGGRVYGPYTGRHYRSMRDTDIEHVVALSEAHDSGLCAAGPTVRRRFASDPLNLTLAVPEVNRCGAGGKCGSDAAEWQPPMNVCWFAARVVAVKHKYRLAVDHREAAALERVLAGCGSTAMIVTHATGTTAAPRAAPTASSDALALWDDNGNGRITCNEARRHGIAPVPRGHPAYQFMRDGDGDGVVCE